MPSNSVFKGLREIIFAMYDNNGNERITYFEPLSKISLSPARLELLRNICDLVLNTDVVSNYSKLYLKERNIRLKDVVEVINRANKEKMELVKVKTGKNIEYEVGGEVSYNTVVSKIEYDRKKFEAAVGGSNIIVDILYYPNKSIEHYQVCVSKLMEEYKGDGGARKKLNLNIERGTYAKEYDGDFMKDYGDILYTYLEATRLRVERELNRNQNFVGYFNYLLSGIYTDDEKVQRDRKNLLELLNDIEHADIISGKTKIEEIKVGKELDNTDIIEEGNIEENYEEEYYEEDSIGGISDDYETEDNTSEIEDNKDTDELLSKFSLVKNTENTLDDEDEDDDDLDFDVSDLIIDKKDNGKALIKKAEPIKKDEENNHVSTPAIPKTNRIQF